MATEKISPAELLTVLYDAGSYTPLFEAGGGVAAAYGMVGGQGVYAVCQNGQAQSAADVSVCRRTLQLAAGTGNPVVTFYNAPGVKLEDGLESLSAARALATEAAKLSGVVPQLAVVTGVCGATNAIAAASADLCIMAKDAQLFLTPPFLANAAGEGAENAGTAAAAVEAGVVSLLADDAKDAASLAAKLLALLPANNLAEPAFFEFEDPAGSWPAKYTGQGAIDALCDTGSAVELFAGFGDGITTSLATIGGNVVGIAAANGADSYLGRLCAARAARFARLCDAYSIPLITVLNTGGFKVSSHSDVSGAIREASRLSAVYADATTAKIAILAGSTFGPAYAALSNADLTIAMAGSVTAPVRPTAAVSVLYKDEIQASGNSLDSETAARAKQYEQDVAGAEAVRKAGLAEFVAQPADLRATVLSALDILQSKRAQRLPKKHGTLSV